MPKPTEAGSDYIEIHSFLDSSKAASAHFKHRFLLHHVEGSELAVRIFGETVINSENQEVSTKLLLIDHLIEDVGSIVKIEDWARDLMPKQSDQFYKFLAKKRGQIEADEIIGEKELLGAFNLTEKDRSAVKAFLAFPLENSRNPAALLVSHNSFAVYLAEKVFSYAFVKNNGSNRQLLAVREVFERLIFLRLKTIYSPAEIIARTTSKDWMRGADAGRAKAEKNRLIKSEI